MMMLLHGSSPWCSGILDVCSDLFSSKSIIVNIFGRYTTNPNKEHWKVVQWIFKYLRGSFSVCLQFGKMRDDIIEYTDSNYDRDLNKRKSLIGYVFIIEGCAVS